MNVKCSKSVELVKMISNVDMSGICQKHISAMMKEYGGALLDAAGEKYGFDAEEAKSSLISENFRVDSRKKTEKVAKKVTTPPKARTIIPFCGENSRVCCQGIRMNHQLFTQCTNAPAGGDFCQTCQKQADKSSNGKPTYGTIEDRKAVPVMDYVAGGKKVVRYSRVMDKLKITREEALAAAAEQGVTISEDQFLVETTKKGRPSKDASVSDTESETSTTSSDKKAGRPKKAPKVVKTTTGDDMIQEALDAVASTPSEETKSNEETKPKPTKTEITKAKVGELKEMCAAAGLKEDKKTAMQQSLRAHFGYESDDDKKPAAKPTPKPTPEPEPELVAEEEEDSDTGTLSEIDHEDEADQAEDEADEEKDEVSPWVAPNGTTYLRTEDGTLYDLKTHELVGEWDDEKNELRPFDVEDDEE